MKHALRSPRTGRFVPAPRSTKEQLVNAHNQRLRIMRWLDALGVAVLSATVGITLVWAIALAWGVAK